MIRSEVLFEVRESEVIGTKEKRLEMALVSVLSLKRSLESK